MKISDDDLIEAYYSALQLNLDQDFILMLEEEMMERNLTITKKVMAD